MKNFKNKQNILENSYRKDLENLEINSLTKKPN